MFDSAPLELVDTHHPMVVISKKNQMVNIKQELTVLTVGIYLVDGR